MPNRSGTFYLSLRAALSSVTSASMPISRARPGSFRPGKHGFISVPISAQLEARRAGARLIGRLLRRIETPDPAQLGDRRVMPVDAQIDHRPVVSIGDMQAGAVLVAGFAAGRKTGFERAHQPFGERIAFR